MSAVSSQEFLQADSLKSFRWAVIRLATYIADPMEAKSKPRLVFATVSLLTSDRAHPNPMAGVDIQPVAKGRLGKVFFRRTTLTAAAAIEWYRSTQIDATPIPSLPEEIKKKLDGTSIKSSEFIDEPVWPSLSFPTGADLLNSRGNTGDPAPFIGSGSVPARVHRRFGHNSGFESLTADSASVRFLERRLHINLAKYPEYLGSVALVVPNGMVKSVRNFVVPDAGNVNERLVYRVVPRSGQSLNGLDLTVTELSGGILSRFETISVPQDGLIVIDRIRSVQACGYALTHEKDGLLAYQTPLSFIRTVRGSMGIGGRTIRVQAPKSDAKKSVAADYTVSEIGHEVPIQAGQQAPMPLLERIVTAASQRDRAVQAERYHQTWFNDGEREKALEYIRNRIRVAQSQVLVADPYFGANQLMQFLHAVARTDVSISILTSRLAFESHFVDDSLGKTSQRGSRKRRQKAVSPEIAKLQAFDAAMQTFVVRGIKSCSAFVLAGKSPPLHDRFLVIDGAVLFLGNSLNTLGDRASLIVDVPEPESIIERLESMLATSTEFDAYRTSRVNRRAQKKKSKK